jgi:hypothetical protein
MLKFSDLAITGLLLTFELILSGRSADFEVHVTLILPSLADDEVGSDPLDDLSLPLALLLAVLVIPRLIRLLHAEDTYVIGEALLTLSVIYNAALMITDFFSP